MEFAFVVEMCVVECAFVVEMCVVECAFVVEMDVWWSVYVLCLCVGKMCVEKYVCVVSMYTCNGRK